MGKLTDRQVELFNILHESRLEDFKTFNKRSYRGIWNSVIDKYPESAHFVYELLQNADDAEATEVYIIVRHHEMLFKHNGTKHFDITSEDARHPGDINSITGIGDSSKTETQNKIGKFGVGFKAVFQYTNIPEIYDDYFKFKIENYIVPTLLDYDHPERDEGETLFVFPFKDGDRSYQDIIKRLENLQNPILFLRNLRKITWRIDRKKDRVGDELGYSKELVEKKEYDDGITLERFHLHEPLGMKSIFLFSQLIGVGDGRELPISIGYYYDEVNKRLITNIKQNIFCFFPTKESFKTCFVSHAPFLLTDNRQNLKPDEHYNESLVQFLAELAADSLVILRDYGKATKNLLINENLLEIIPKYKEYYWQSLDELFEEPMKNEFQKKLKTEPLLLSRSNKYLKMSDALIGTPRELINLLSKEQLCMLLKGEYKYFSSWQTDFLKWELAQKISSSGSDIYVDVKEYSSEKFGKDITAKFMDAQDIKWVTRFYTFLRTAAPKLWKIIGSGKNIDYSSLVYRSAPIIKTQRGEWVSPFIDGKTPNVYLPLKKDTKSEYNFIADEYLKNDLAVKFFRELDIKEPDEFDYIRSIILTKFRGEEFEIDDDDIKSDFTILFEYYRKVQGTNSELSFVTLLKENLWLVGSDKLLNKPTSMYLRSDFLESYFDQDEVIYVDEHFYSSTISKYNLDAIEDFFLLLGVRKYPTVNVVQRYSKWGISSPTKEQINTAGYSETSYFDLVMEGFADAVDDERFDKDLSIMFWNEVLPGIGFQNYDQLRVRYRRKYARTYNSAYYDSSFKCDLRNKAWLYNSDDELCSAEDLFVEDLAPEYNRSNGLLEFLGIEKREKSIVELGGTEEQQKQMDLGKRIKSLTGNIFTDDEIIQIVSKATAEKTSGKHNIEQNIQVYDTIQNNNVVSPEVDQESLEDKLKEKWEKKANETIRHPHSSSINQTTTDSVQPSNSTQDEVQPFFDSAHTTEKDKSSKNEDYTVEKKLKAKDEEAKATAEKASELVQILEILRDTPKFTYKWYKLLMELMHANKTKVSDRHVQIDFSEWELTNSDKVLHLTNPSQPVPAWLNDADNIVLSTLGKNPHKIEGILMKVDEISVDVSVEIDKELQRLISEANKIRIVADNTSNIIDSLEKRFLQLGFEDDYDMNANLVSDLKLIYGPPGTGKTTRLVEIISDILKNAEKKTNILVLTPTNKAADVIATKMVDDNDCYNYLTRFGTTESLYLIEDAAVVLNRETTDMDLLDHNVLVTTAARYAYDYFQPDDTFICDYNWDYIIIDEASMIDIVTITYVLYKGITSKIIISGDPKQIQPVAQNDMPQYNVYDLVGLHRFEDALLRYKRFPIEALTVQHRSIPSIGNLVSRFAYDGQVVADPNRSPQKPLTLDGLSISDINFMGFDIVEFDQIYGLSAINGSAFHLYSAIYTYNMVEYVTKQIQKKYPNEFYTIGIVCPYRAEADTIKHMLENRTLDKNNCSVTCGTVHGFQGDECDIMFVVLNPPSICSINSHINNENILNVAISRARDYLFFVLPKGQVKGFTRKNDIGRLADANKRSIYNCSDVESIIFGSSNYISSNTHVTCHLPVNVYYDQNAIYDVRISDEAVDIKININD